MRRVSKLLVVALLLAQSLEAQQPGDWVKVAPLGAGFSISMPAKPEEDVQPGDTLTVHIFSVTTDNALFLAAYGDYAPSIRFKVDDELTANRDKFLKGLDAGLTSSKNITKDGRQGIEFTGESDQASFKSQVYIFGTRFHQIAVAVFKGKNDSENSNKFFASFEFTGSETRPKP